MAFICSRQLVRPISRIWGMLSETFSIPILITGLLGFLAFLLLCSLTCISLSPFFINEFLPESSWIAFCSSSSSSCFFSSLGNNLHLSLSLLTDLSYNTRIVFKTFSPFLPDSWAAAPLLFLTKFCSKSSILDDPFPFDCDSLSNFRRGSPINHDSSLSAASESCLIFRYGVH